MGEIREEHREYALVDRMSDLLKDPPKTEFAETFCYAIFSSIIPWVCQRARSKEYRFIFEQLEKTPMPQDVSNYFRMEPDFEIPNAGEALVYIRNAISHADARRVFPINDRRFLRGFKWVLSRRVEGGDEEIGKLSLRTLGMRNVGTFYADFYCRKLRSHQSEESDQQFYDAVRMSLMEAA